MPAISPTTLLVSGSISMTLSPAALVWTIRTVAACSERVTSGSAPARTTAATKDLVFIATHFKLPSHVVDPLFRGLGPGTGRPGIVDARLHRVQGENRAPPAREASRPRALCRLSFHRHELPAAAALARAEGVDRRAVAEELPDGQPVRAARRADEKPVPGDGAGARGGRRRISSRRQALADPGRSGVEDDGVLGQRREVTWFASVAATKTRKHPSAGSGQGACR